MNKLEIWNALKQPPAEALRQINAGRLKGKSDISPQWRYKAMTEQFGPCGIGWKFTIDKTWSEPGSGNQTFAFAIVSVYIRDGEKWSDPIPGQGGSMLVEQESKGPYSNDEGYKMAITDALGTALKMIGVAADVYMGKWDGTKYRQEPGENGYTAMLDSINECQTMEKLQSVFTAAWAMVKNDPAGQKVIAAAKDAKKKELAQ